MVYLWDTNMTIHRLRRSKTYQQLDEVHAFFASDNQVVVSIVSVGEIYSLAYQRQWQSNKLARLAHILGNMKPLPIARQAIIDAYVQIDAYSQGKSPKRPLPTGLTSRNMGKNDLWIAATAYHLGASLVTTDRDFDHLDGVFFSVVRG